MPVFTIEIDGKATLACAVRSHEGAVAFAGEPFIRSELRAIVDLNGNPLWDGTAEFTVRPANKPEREVWEVDLTDALRGQVYDDREDAVDGSCFSFLVPYLD